MNFEIKNSEKSALINFVSFYCIPSQITGVLKLGTLLKFITFIHSFLFTLLSFPLLYTLKIQRGFTEAPAYATL